MRGADDIPGDGLRSRRLSGTRHRSRAAGFTLVEILIAAAVIGLGLVGVAAGAGILFGGVGAIVALVAGGNRKTRVPYGPFMAAGALLSVFVGQQIADAYVRLLGG